MTFRRGEAFFRDFETTELALETIYKIDEAAGIKVLNDTVLKYALILHSIIRSFFVFKANWDKLAHQVRFACT